MDEKILMDLINNNKGLIYKIISKYTKYYEFDDLYQVSIIGIIKAYQNYTASFNVKFTTYAYKYILSEVIGFVNNSRLIRVSRDYNKVYKKILEARGVLTQKLMKEPTTKEIALFTEIDESIINDVLRYKDDIKSLDEVLDMDDKKLTLLDVFAVNNGLDNEIEHLLLKDELNKLTKEERELIILRYFECQTQSQIAKMYGTNQVQISRNEQKILKKLKNNMCQAA